MRGILLILAVMCFTITACDNDTQRETDEQLIKEYIDENGLDAQSTSSGLHYVIEEEGSNDKPTINDRVFVRYTGTFLNGQEFDSSNGNIVDFPLSGVIDGWQEGIQLFGRGGNGILIVPSHLAYGQTGRGSIPPNSVLVFDVEVVDFN